MSLDPTEFMASLIQNGNEITFSPTVTSSIDLVGFRAAAHQKRGDKDGPFTPQNPCPQPKNVPGGCDPRKLAVSGRASTS